VLPGHYRFEIVAPDGSFAEVDCLFEFGGESAVLNASLKPTTAPEGMVLVPAGSYKVGRDSPHAFEKERTVSVPAFWIDAHEVTNAEYFAFVTATGRELPPHWVLGYDKSLDDRPVVGISWEDMQAYAAWIGKRLPTHVEWECAARAPDGRLYPWGEDAGEDRVALTTEQLDDLARAEWQYGYRVYAALVEPVRARPTSCSALGLYHMLSNVAECTASLIYEQQNTVLVKGGSFDKAPSTWDLSRSGSVLRTASSYRLGFRCARSAAPASSLLKEN
jgi:formylglycine-generating enzyme required for sulfatase activity